MLNSKVQKNADVVELTNDWQQVGGLLGNVMANLKVVPVAASHETGPVQSVTGNKYQNRQPERAHCPVRKAA